MTNEELISILEKRFIVNKKMHEDIIWNDVLKRLNDKSLNSLRYMEETGGEPDVIMYDKENDKYVFFDTSKESPIGRRSFCYDLDALNSRKNNKPNSDIITEANNNMVKILDEEEYKYLQSLGEFDLKSSSWILTPVDIRKLGGALFGDKKYNRTFIYHNGAESYYSNRGFRVLLKI
ncbi:MAG: DUF4256 domain-containing protein [Acholeplasmatales bacterium]|nr:DUF4256 domain-containing protein [Acholeplasmatales bacterium]